MVYPEDPIPKASAISDTKPSEETEEFWLHANSENDRYPKHTARGGKWNVFVPNAQADAFWAKIKAALADGRLGDRAKVSTARPNANSNNPNKSVIIVYTYDGDDEEDVWRVREALRQLGVTEKIGWKADHATRQGLYQVRGHTRVSRYWG